MPIILRTEATFVEAFEKLPKHRRKAVKKALVLFMENPKIPSLRFRKFKSLEGIFLINGQHGDRIILKKSESGSEEFIAADVGLHDNVLREWNRKK